MAAAWLLLAAGAWAADTRDRTLGQFYHSAWTTRDGAPGQVTALAQTADGYLWLGTQTGLYRFDGVRFERYRPAHGGDFPASSVASLYAPPSGGLWIGFRYGFVSHLQDDRATHYGASAGLPTATVYALAATPDGRLWGATFNGLVRLDGTQWHVVGPALGLPGVRARNLSVDHEGRLWVASENALAYLPLGGERFVVVSRDVGRINRIAQAGDGSIWVADVDRGVFPAWHDGRDPDDVGPVLRLPSTGLLFDRDGALWMPTLGQGLRRVPRVRDHVREVIDAKAQAAQQFGEHDGLSSDYATAIMQDREGNIWVGGSRGLDRFRVSRLLPAMLPSGSTDFAMAPRTGGGIWVGTKNRPLMHVDANGARDTPFAEGITAATRDGDATWLGGPSGIWTLDGETPRLFARLPADDYTGVQAVVGDGDGGAWVSINRPGIYHFTKGAWQHDPLPQVENDPSPLVLMRDTRNRLWMGFARGILLIRDHGRDTRLSESDGLSIGNVTVLLQDGDGAWAGGERGLVYVAHGHVHPVAIEGEGLQGVSGLVRDARGDLWVNAAQGIVRIAAADLARAVTDPAFAAPTRLFDSMDGLPGTPAQFRPLPTAVAADDGRLWFATTSGIVSVDPADLHRNVLAPNVFIRGVATDAGYWDTTGPVTLPPRTERLRVLYTSTSLSMPERVRFRYRMDGIDTRWHEAGEEGEAMYTAPAPGHYRFRVTAANEDGVWNPTGASLDITILPAFYQTAWFALLCMALAAAAIWLAMYVRMRRVEAQLLVRLRERQSERERIARDLHDTLLQSVQGLTMRFQAVANRLPPGEPLRDAMESALDRAERVIVEARDRVRDLRGESAAGAPLDIALRELAQSYRDDHTVPIAVHARDEWRSLDPLVCDELFAIGREAMHNAVMHADASEIHVVLVRRLTEVRLRVTDDGRGIPPEVIREGKPGHWGLRGMRERALAIGGHTSIASAPPHGTDVLVRVPVGRAFPRRFRGRWLP